MKSKRITLTKEIAKQIKDARDIKRYTQQDVADHVNISKQQYQRIELSSIKKADRDVVLRIFHYLEMNENTIIASPTIQGSYRLPRDIVDYLNTIKIKHNLDSDTASLLFCLKEHRDNENLRNIRYNLEDMLEQTISNTYGKTMKLLNKNLEDKIIVLEEIKKEFGIDTVHIEKELEEKRILKKRAKEY